MQGGKDCISGSCYNVLRKCEATSLRPHKIKRKVKLCHALWVILALASLFILVCPSNFYQTISKWIIIARHILRNVWITVLLCLVKIAIIRLNQNREMVELAHGIQKTETSWVSLKLLQTWFTWSSLLIMFRRTSGNSSFKRERKIGRSCSIVASCIDKQNKV